MNETNETIETIRIMGDWSPLRTSGAKNEIVIEPDDDGGATVWPFANVGPGSPESVWHRRAISIPYGDTVDGAALEEALRENVDLLEQIAACYEGCRWDGSNHRGRWRLETEALLNELCGVIDDVPTVWDADDWLCADVAASLSGIRNALDRGLSIEEWAQEEADGAADGGFVLDPAALVETARHLIGEDDAEDAEEWALTATMVERQVIDTCRAAGHTRPFATYTLDARLRRSGNHTTLVYDGQDWPGYDDGTTEDYDLVPWRVTRDRDGREVEPSEWDDDEVDWDA